MLIELFWDIFNGYPKKVNLITKKMYLRATFNLRPSNNHLYRAFAFSVDLGDIVRDIARWKIGNEPIYNKENPNGISNIPLCRSWVESPAIILFQLFHIQDGLKMNEDGVLLWPFPLKIIKIIFKLNLPCWRGGLDNWVVERDHPEFDLSCSGTAAALPVG